MTRSTDSFYISFGLARDGLRETFPLSLIVKCHSVVLILNVNVVGTSYVGNPGSTHTAGSEINSIGLWWLSDCAASTRYYCSKSSSFLPRPVKKCLICHIVKKRLSQYWLCGQVAAKEPICTDNGVTEVGCHSSSSSPSTKKIWKELGTHLQLGERGEFLKNPAHNWYLNRDLQHRWRAL